MQDRRAEAATPAIAVVGGGASGLAAAIAAAQTWRACGGGRAHAAAGRLLDIRIFEKDDRMGRSVLATGNGRCNVFNTRPEAGSYRNRPLVQAVLRAAESCRPPLAAVQGQTAVERFFSGLGLVWREDEEGRCWPVTNKASTVLDVLRTGCRANGARECCDSPVTRIERDGAGSRFALRLADGRISHADAVVVATGSGLAGGLLPEGIEAEPPTAMLCPLSVREKWVRSLENIRVRAEVRLVRGDRTVRQQAGEVQFRKFGVSGIAVFNLSRDARAGDQLVLDLLPAFDEVEAMAFLRRRLEAMGAALGRTPTVEETLSGLVLPRVAEVVLGQLGLEGGLPVTADDISRLTSALKNLTLTVTGLANNVSHQITRGGIAVEQLAPETLQIASAPGLFAAGEAVDVDADCGGFNLLWAWASGYLAGTSAAKMLAE
ncbi:aminoacetone oxidase family FAD-binding enzyme [Parvibacter caecicola]|uniref:aminoacetone oxidase family FAD-binding enzyme n=1 Tax=Parvibacter caecicola TaxID=747645 RepID=UPI00248B1237|nr:aminoacetone oxidase family FAD-binding enzyme [Parvibacter caecicola]